MPEVEEIRPHFGAPCSGKFHHMAEKAKISATFPRVCACVNQSKHFRRGRLTTTHTQALNLWEISCKSLRSLRTPQNRLRIFNPLCDVHLSANRPDSSRRSKLLFWAPPPSPNVPIYVSTSLSDADKLIRSQRQVINLQTVQRPKPKPNSNSGTSSPENSSACPTIAVDLCEPCGTWKCC